MGTTAIDIMQSAQITTLQNDVSELTTKLNAIVTDIATIKGKVDTLITDMTSVKDKIGTTYPATGVYGLAGDTLYQRLYQLDTDIADVTSQLSSHISNHPGTGNQGSAGRASGGMSNLNSFSTSSSGNVTQTASAASTTGVYTPQSQQVITVTDASATRAREVARDAVKRIRGI